MCVAGLTGLPDINVCPVSQGTAGSPAVSPVDERLDSVGASVFCEEKKPPPPCAFRPHPARNDDLRDEIAHMVVRQDAEIDRRYTRSPKYHNYLHAVQHDKVEVTHRRKVFEWNLEVRQLSYWLALCLMRRPDLICSLPTMSYDSPTRLFCFLSATLISTCPLTKRARLSFN